MNKEEQQYKYFAFISYNSHDTTWGKRLQRKLEGYRMPATLCSEHGWERKPINPVFFAPTDIQPGGLNAELQERLKASRNLVVICSPNSAKSEWVGKEIEFFHSLGRTKDIHFFIVDGIPHSGNPDTECFNPIVDTLGLPEILGANIHEKVFRSPWLNRERAYVQLITKLLGVEFDDFCLDYTSYPDINDLFKVADILISDYSACIADYSILERPVICFAYDYDDYKSTRGLYIDFDKEMPNGIFKTEDDVIEHIKTMDYVLECSKTKKMIKDKYTYIGGSATKMCVQAMFKKILR